MKEDMQGGNTSGPRTMLPLEISNAKVSAGLAQSLYEIHDQREDHAVDVVCKLAAALAKGNRWAHQHAPVLLPAAMTVIAAADAACDAAIGTHIPGVIEALDEAEHQLRVLLGETDYMRNAAAVFEHLAAA